MMKVNKKIQKKLANYFAPNEYDYPALDEASDLDLYYEGVTFSYIKKYVLEDKFKDDTEILANLYYFCLNDEYELGFLHCPSVGKIVFNRYHDGYLKCMPETNTYIEYPEEEYKEDDLEELKDFGNTMINAYKEYFTNDN